MRIKIQLTQKSIQDAIRKLEHQKKVLLEQAIPELLEEGAKWIVENAKQRLESADIGKTIKAKINKRWSIRKKSSSSILIVNDYYRAAFVEFGIGIVGESSPHPNSSKGGYEYNVDSDYKDDERGWTFDVSDESELDIPRDSIIAEAHIDDNLYIYTKGTQGVWFLYNAMEDFKKGEYQRIWKQIKSKYWGK